MGALSKNNDDPNIAAIRVENVSVYYGALAALLDVNISIEQGSFATIVGPNGGGKTTLFKMILGLIKPSRGHVYVFGKPPGEVRNYMGYVPQSTRFDPLFPVRVFDVVRMGCLDGGANLRFRRRKETQERVHTALKSVGLESLSYRWFNSLSGGQKQRVLIARALAGNPKVLLLDEPTSNVDISAEEKILQSLEKLRGAMTILLVTHYPKVAMRFLGQVYCVNQNVHIHPPTDTMDEDLMLHITGMAPPSIFKNTNVEASL
ncbi:MAG: metal ABC transporter ATP-binding protein [Candidatus Hydrogenedentales bacterium]|jgi:zinc transport system ATP-binding protein